MTEDVWELYGESPDPLDDQAVWRGAKQMMELFPETASLEAAQRADKALELGDLTKFNLWHRIAKATEALERTRPEGGEAIN